ncbi:MAG: flagellar biosynthesis anti-sigma factor FlgM [Chloroflexota bacterium]
MEIERTQPQASRAIEALNAARAARTQASLEPAADLTIGADTVEISDRARELARARRAVEDTSEVRTEKVAQIKKSVDDGTYSVPAELLAQKLIDGWSNGR